MRIRVHLQGAPGRIATLLIACALGGWPPPAAATDPPTADEWPGWRGPQRDGKSPDTGLLKEWPAQGPPLVWKVDGIGAGFSSVAVSGGRIFTTGKVGERLMVFAFTLDGKPAWKVDFGPAFTGSHPGARSTPMIDGGKLYLISGNGLIGCLDARNGKRRWSREMSEFGGKRPGWGYAESVLIHGKLAVVTPGGKHCIAALNKASGKTIWKSTGFEAQAQYGSCIAFEFGGTPLIVAGTRGGIVGVDARDGRALWSNPWSAGNTANCPTPVVSSPRVFWANGYGKGGICLELEGRGRKMKATEAWTTAAMNCHHGGYIVREGHIYGNNGSGWACLDLASGEQKWRARGVGKGSLCYADGMLYLFGERRGRVGLATCSPAGLEMKGTFQVEGEGPAWAHPVVIGGRLYIRYDQHLYCFDVRARGRRKL